MRSTSRSAHRALVVVAAAATLLAACGSDSKSSNTTTGSTAAPTTASSADSTTASSTGSSTSSSAGSSDSSVPSSAPDDKTTGLGQPGLLASSDARSGQTINLGLVNTEQGAASYPEFRQGAMAIADYVNAHGGINGAQLKFDVCTTNGTPEGSIACANTSIDHKNLAQFVAVDLALDSAVPKLTEAGMPVVLSLSAGSSDTRLNPLVSALNPSVTALIAGPNKFAFDQGAKHIGSVGFDVPSIHTTIPPIDEAATKALGVPFDFFFVNPSNPDYSATILALKNAGVDWVNLHLNEGGCTTFVSTAKSLGYEGHIIGGSCSQFIDADPDAAVGHFVSGPVYPFVGAAQAPASIQPQLQAYSEAMKAAGLSDDVINSPNAQDSYAGMGNFIRILQDIPTDTPITSQSIQEAIHEAKFTGMFGNELDCTGANHLETDTASCSLSIPIVEVKAGASGPEVVPAGGGIYDATDWLRSVFG